MIRDIRTIHDGVLAVIDEIDDLGPDLSVAWDRDGGIIPIIPDTKRPHNLYDLLSVHAWSDKMVYLYTYGYCAAIWCGELQRWFLRKDFDDMSDIEQAVLTSREAAKRDIARQRS